MVSEKYSVGEFERRFLLDELPPGAANPRHIVDDYIENTRLRLRSITITGHEDRQLKLGHKRRVSEDDPTAIMCTSMYLDDAEFETLSSLPSQGLGKTRWDFNLGSTDCAVDVFHDKLDGLIMLEVDLSDADRFGRFEAPSWLGPEVTYVEAFTGGELAGATYRDLAPAISKAYNDGT